MKPYNVEYPEQTHSYNRHEGSAHEHLRDSLVNDHRRFPESPIVHDNTGLHYGKGPRSYKRTDERINELVCERLTDDPYVDASNIEIVVHDAEVIITGTVESREEKRRAEDIVEGISGIKNVENRLRLHDQSGNNFIYNHGDIRSKSKETFR